MRLAPQRSGRPADCRRADPPCRRATGRLVIVIQPYRASWPGEFQTLRAHLAAVLGGHARHIAHIGSTAVPGMAAKDVIDVQIGVERLDPGVADLLTGAGYNFVARIDRDHVPPGAAAAEADWRKLYCRGRTGERPSHIHVRALGSANHRYALLFRDYLRAHAGQRLAIEAIKRELARRHAHDAEAYYSVKDPVYDLVWHAANDWAARAGWRPDAAAEA
ncbi:MAG: GrpB family protein [Rubrivivax sp.]|nr:MAG: GrpB family protein [Rubrivivax sp.]